MAIIWPQEADAQRAEKEYRNVDWFRAGRLSKSNKGLHMLRMMYGVGPHDFKDIGLTYVCGHCGESINDINHKVAICQT